MAVSRWTTLVDYSRTTLEYLILEGSSHQFEGLKVNIHLLNFTTSDDLELRLTTMVHGRYLLIRSVIGAYEFVTTHRGNLERLLSGQIRFALHKLLSAALAPMTLAQWASDGTPVEYWVLDQALENGHLTEAEYLGIRRT